jgi:hypothetical protein
MLVHSGVVVGFLRAVAALNCTVPGVGWVDAVLRQRPGLRWQGGFGQPMREFLHAPCD